VNPRIGAVVVTYNSAAVLAECLRSLSETKDVELSTIVVVDNASRDDSVMIARAAEQTLPVRTVETGRNAGYSAAVNAGLAAMDLDQLDAVMVLNPDCSLRPDSLVLLWQALQRPGFGIAAPRLVNPDGSLQPTLRRMPTVSRAFGEAVLGKLAGRVGLGELVTDPAEHDKPGPAAWATGAALLISVEAVRATGPWDESFLLYSEETDFILRAADRGWRLWYEPTAEVEHVGGESGTNPTLSAMLVVNKVRLFRRRHNPVASAAYFASVLLGESVRALMGRRTSRAAVLWLLRPSRRLRTLAT
jgi:N-acetylglucosaminyl-diphospho-decaprenol L-rhamnosyltransferase